MTNFIRFYSQLFVDVFQHFYSTVAKERGVGAFFFFFLSINDDLADNWRTGAAGVRLNKEPAKNLILALWNFKNVSHKFEARWSSKNRVKTL